MDIEDLVSSEAYRNNSDIDNSHNYEMQRSDALHRCTLRNKSEHLVNHRPLSPGPEPGRPLTKLTGHSIMLVVTNLESLTAGL